MKLLLLSVILVIWNPLPTVLGEEISTSKQHETFQDASDYAESHPVVAYSIIGRNEGITPIEIGEHIKGLFAVAGKPALYFISKDDRLGGAITFFVKGQKTWEHSSGLKVNADAAAHQFIRAWPAYQTYPSQ